MGKSKNWSDEAIAWETGTGEFDREATIDNREFAEGAATQYEAPKDKKWKARNVVTIHWQHTGFVCPYPSMVHIFACVIDHSNINTGRCDASQRLIALETRFHRDTVRKVLGWLEVNTPFLEIERRGRRPGGKFKSHAYHVQWTALELFWIALTEDIEATKEAWRDVTDAPCRVKGQHGHAESRGNTDPAESRGGSNHEDLNHEVGNTSLRVRSDERTTIAGVKKEEEEEGIQGEQEAKPSPLPEGPTEGQVQEIVSGYCTALHWQYLTQEDFDAAVAAEFQKPGSGRQVVDVAAAQNAKEAASNG